LFIEGKLSYRQYDDKEGNRHYITEVVADNLMLLDKKAE
jgi:single-strand DNA-binding protein